VSLSEERRERRERKAKLTADFWEELPDQSFLHFRLHPTRTEYAEYRYPESMPFDVFLRFLTPQLTARILQSVPDGHWIDSDGDGRIRCFQPTLKNTYISVAIYLWMMARCRNAHFEHDDHTGRNAAIELAREHFLQQFPEYVYPSKHVVNKFLSNFHITKDFYAELSSNFNAELSELGAFVAGDEKLLHFTGDSVYIRIVKTKPDRVGIWYYELAVKLQCGRVFVIYIRMNDSNQLKGVHIPVDAVVRDWVDAIQNGGGRVPDPNILLSFDNYYMSNASHELLLSRNQYFVGACKSNTFSELTDETTWKVQKRGDYYVLGRAFSQELFAHVWDLDDSIGKNIASQTHLSGSMDQYLLICDTSFRATTCTSSLLTSATEQTTLLVPFSQWRT